MGNHNPYVPPDAKLADPAAAPGSPIKAVLIGLAVDIGGSFLVTLILALAYGMYLAATGVSQEDIALASRSIDTDSWLFYASSLAGGVFSFLGGYVCARIARRSEYTLGVVLAVLSAAFGLWMSMDPNQVGVLASLTLASIGAVMIGVRFGHAANRRVH
jgi:hypothetical protein